VDPLSPTLILYPAFAMVALTLAVLLRMRSLRFAAVRRGEVSIQFFRAYPEGVEPEPLRVISRHYVNLFEMPVLFYVVVVMVYVTQQVNLGMVAGAWLYVALRYGHSFVHLTSNHVVARFTLYFASTTVLALLWGALLVQLLRTG
jgi:hypothetical protein